MAKPREICVIQLARFGDLIQTSPFLQLLRKQEPDARITLVTDSRVAEAGRLLYGVDAVETIDLAGVVNQLTGNLLTDYGNLRAWSESWRSNRLYDRLILLNQGVIPEAISTFFSAKRREGPLRNTTFNRPHKFLQSILSDRWHNPVHLSEVWAAYARSTFPVPAPRLNSDSFGTSFAFPTVGKTSTSYKNKVFTVNLGAGAAGRRLTTENLADLVRYLLKNSDGRVALVGLPEDVEVADLVLQAVPEEQRNRIIDLAGKTSLKDLAGVLKASEVLVTTDTGTLQLSSATETKSVGLFFAGTNPLETGAYGPEAVAIIRNDSPLPGTLPTKYDMILAAQAALRLMNNESLEGLGDENDACTVLVARSAPVGVEYRPLRTDGFEPVGKGRRWLPLLRHLLWGSASDDKIDEEFKADPSVAIGVDDLQRLKTLLEQIMQSRGQQHASWDEETAWLAHAIAAFPKETSQWLASRTKNHAGRIYA